MALALGPWPGGQAWAAAGEGAGAGAGVGAGMGAGGQVAGAEPATLQARSLSGRVDQEAVAEGEVELQRGGLLIRGDRLVYRPPQETAVAEGRVDVSQGDTRFKGPRLQLHLPTFEGRFEAPDYQLGAEGGGHAAAIDFQGRRRFVATDPSFTSCTRDGEGEPDWLLTARRLRVDLDANEAVAEGATLRFLGLPVLPLPWISFPVTRDRKSGWLSPRFDVDSRSGFEFGVPYYWNMAPDRDATLTPRWITRRGAALGAELRYLAPSHSGRLDLDLTPNDREVGRSRHGWRWNQSGTLRPWVGGAAPGWFEIEAIRVSDDDWWKDFRLDLLGLTPRLLSQRAALQAPLTAGGAGFAADTYLRTQRWQPLQSADDPFAAPYQRDLQAGLQARSAPGQGLAWSLQGEFNRFSLPDERGTATRPTGDRTHVLGELAWPLRASAGWLVPRLGVNAAAYRLDQALPDGRRDLGRAIPTMSLDAGVVFDRDTTLFGRDWRQTLEPRLLVVRTPRHDDSTWLAFDSAGRDLGIGSIFQPNDFSGVDRVSDANHVNVGAVTRFVDASAGEELLTLAAVQRYQLRDQLITPDGVPFTGDFSDLLLFGATRFLPQWPMEASLRWNADANELRRSVVSVRHLPGPGRSLALTHRYAQGLARQWELGWQWPLAGSALPVAGATATASAASASSTCNRRWDALGGLTYSQRDHRVVSSKAGFTVAAGCWSGLVQAEWVSLGPSASTFRVSVKLDLAGLGGLRARP